MLIAVTRPGRFLRPLLGAALCGWALPAGAQTGVLVVAHGAGSAWNAGVYRVVEQVHWDKGPVTVAFLMGPESVSRGWDSSVTMLVRQGAKEIVVVPLLVSSHGGHYHQIRGYAGELDSLSSEGADHQHGAVMRPPVPMRVTAALDAAPELGTALLERWRALPAADRRRPLVLVAHGPVDDAQASLWVRDLEAAAAPVAAEGSIRVTVGLLRDDAPPAGRAAAVADLRATIQRLAAQSGDTVTVLPVLISSGEIDQVKIPADLAGLPLHYVPAPLVPLPALARWIERVALEKVVP